MPVMSRLLRRFQSAPPEPEQPADPVLLTVDQVTDLLLQRARHENPGDPDVRHVVRDAVAAIEHNAMSRLADDEEKDAWWLLQRGRTARAINVLHRDLRTGQPDFMRAAAATRLGALTILNDRATAICYFEQAWIIDRCTVDACLHWGRLVLMQGEALGPSLLACDLLGLDRALGEGRWHILRHQPIDCVFSLDLDWVEGQPIRERNRVPHILAVIFERAAPVAAAGEMHGSYSTDYPGFLQSGQALAREMDDRQSLFRLIAAQARYELTVDEGAEIDDLINQAIEAGRALPDPADRARVLELLAVSQSRQGRADQAIEAMNDAVGLYRQLGDVVGEAHALRRMADIHQGEKQWQEAAVLLQQALNQFSHMNIPAEIGRTLVLLADLADELGDRPGALQRWQDALIPLVRGGWPKLAETIVDWLEDFGSDIRVGGKLPWSITDSQDLPRIPDGDKHSDLARKYLAEARSLARQRAHFQSMRKALKAVVHQPREPGYLRFFAQSLERLALWDAAEKAHFMVSEVSADDNTDPAVMQLSLRAGYFQRVRYLASDKPPPAGDPARIARIHDLRGQVAYMAGDTDRELSELTLAIHTRETAGQEALTAELYFRKGLNELRRSSTEGIAAARRSFGRAAELFTAEADLVPRAEAHLYLGDMLMRLDEPEDAFQAWAEALDCYRRSRLPAEALLAEERLIQADMV